MSIRIFERLYVIVLVLCSIGVVDALTRPALESHDPNNLSTSVPLSTTIIVSVIYACGVFLVLMRWRRVSRAARVVWPLLTIVTLAALSTLWSVQPLLTMRKSALMLMSTLIGIYIGERFSMEQLARLLAVALCVMVVGVVVVYFVAPSLVVDYAAYIGSSGGAAAWKGLSGTKNTFGGYVAISVALLLLIRFRRFRWLRYVFLAAAAILLLRSRSATSLVACLAIVAAMPLWRLIRMQPKQKWLIYAITVPVLSVLAYLAISNNGAILKMLGRDSTLTGRMNLWPVLFSAISKHPILGYGYGAFWTELKGEALNVIIAMKWLVHGSDNGYIDLCLSLGLAGLAGYLLVVVYAFRMAHRYLTLDKRRIALWPITFLSFFVIQNLCEVHLLETRSFEFLVFVAITTSLAVSRSQGAAAEGEVEDLRPALVNGDDFAFLPQSEPLEESF